MDGTLALVPASYTILPDILNCKEFVNADEIARGLSPFQPEAASFQAGRIMVERISDLVKLKVDFAFETTLTTLSYHETIKEARKRGYKITLIFFWLNDVRLAIERVKVRVKEGGHNIPVDTIKRRYKKGIINLLKIFVDLCDYWIIIDNSSRPYSLVVEGNKNQETKIYNEETWNIIKKEAHEKNTSK